MDASTLAQQINDASEQLQQRGHRVIVRRLRAFLESGDAPGAELFLVRARDALGANDGGLTRVSTGLTAFAGAGGDVARLVTDPAWVEGAARERRFGRLLDAATNANGLGGLADQLARQQRALAAGEPLAAPPSRQVEPKALPPLPKAVPAATEADPRAPLGSIFKPARPRAAVEAEVELEPRTLDLDEGEAEVSTPDLPVDAPGIPDVAELPVSALAVETPEPVRLEPLGVPDSPVPEVVHRPTAAPMVLPELHAPPEMPMAPTGPTKKGDNAGLVIGVVLLLGLIAVGVYFATR
ncbi:hypothetical protein L6V77_08240 [Myxococcota bacterium]|nr:hypothetical protein [Myxococcota bacterium]